MKFLIILLLFILLTNVYSTEIAYTKEKLIKLKQSADSGDIVTAKAI